MWLHLAESAIGTSHLEANTECQDYCGSRIGTSTDESALIFAVADGAGSARFSRIGAQLTVDRFLAEIACFPIGTDAVTRNDVAAVCEKIRNALMSEAHARGCPLRELSATLLGGCISRESAWFCQIGDGGIVLRHEGKYQPVTWPSSGEYVNQTTFITSDEWLDDFQFAPVLAEIEAAAAFTDGLQDLILVHADKSVHAAFFDPMLTTMRRVADSTMLAPALRAFLESKAVNERTDDDKTLVLACWKESQACLP